MRVLPLCLLILAAPAVAQEAPVTALEADLDGDGRTESYSLVPSGEDGVDLRIEGPDGVATIPDAAWTGAMAGTEPSLGLSPAGSLLIRSGNDAIGRDRWALTVIVAERGGALKVAGLNYEWHDTLDPDNGWGSCDLNLLSGLGAMTGPGGKTALTAKGPAPRLTEWSEARLADWLPAECLG